MQAEFKICERGRTNHVIGRVTVKSSGLVLADQVSEARRAAVRQGIIKESDVDKVDFIYIDKPGSRR
jgi:hypothetical protein